MAELILNPGWQITRRVHQGQVLNHLYLSGDTSVAHNSFQPGIASANSSSSSSTATSTVISEGNNTSNNSTTSSQTATPSLAEVNTQVLVDGVSQIYNNVVNPMLENMLKEAE